MTPTMFPGPDVDGRPTWLCRVDDVPIGYEFRHRDTDTWLSRHGDWPPRDGERWVQVRRVPPAPGDRIGVYSVLDDGALVGAMAGDAPTLITFAELCEVLIEHEDPGAPRPWVDRPEEYRDLVADRLLVLADAIWARLTEVARG